MGSEIFRHLGDDSIRNLFVKRRPQRAEHFGRRNHNELLECVSSGALLESCRDLSGEPILPQLMSALNGMQGH